jgi:8-amino-3,8-dideoxy-alpha-D-manno-octulosonate transaminase
MTGTPQPKLGVEEFMMIAERFGFSSEAVTRMRSTISDADLPPYGAHFGRYYGSANPSMGDRFESEARDMFEVKHAYALCNGTSALHAALIAVGAGPGTEVICPGMGFLATSMAVALSGAAPVFCDIDESLQMDPSKLEALITPQTVAVIPTHHWGVVCDLDPIVDIASRHGIKIIEDCAQAPGATYKGRRVGTIGDIGCFSISSYKIIGGGEGGMAVTNDDRLFDRLRQAAEGGGLWRSDRFGVERYEGELFVGANYRLSEFESAVNTVQMQKLDAIIGRYRTILKTLHAARRDFKEIVWQASNDPEGDIGYMIRFFPADDALGQRIAEALCAEGISAGFSGSEGAPDWHVYHQMFPLFAEHADRCRPDLCPNAADLYHRCVRFEIDQWWSRADSEAVAGAINKVLSAFCTPA